MTTNLSYQFGFCGTAREMDAPPLLYQLQITFDKSEICIYKRITQN